MCPSLHSAGSRTSTTTRSGSWAMRWASSWTVTLVSVPTGSPDARTAWAADHVSGDVPQADPREDGRSPGRRRRRSPRAGRARRRAGTNQETRSANWGPSIQTLRLPATCPTPNARGSRASTRMAARRQPIAEIARLERTGGHDDPRSRRRSPSRLAAAGGGRLAVGRRRCGRRRGSTRGDARPRRRRLSTCPMKMVWSPASWASTMPALEGGEGAVEERQAVWPSWNATPWNLSPPDAANRRDSPSCSRRRMLTANQPRSRKSGWAVAAWSTQTSTSGGFRDTEVKALAVRPDGRPSRSRVVTTVTPAAKERSAVRNSIGVSDIGPAPNATMRLLGLTRVRPFSTFGVPRNGAIQTASVCQPAGRWPGG